MAETTEKGKKAKAPAKPRAPKAAAGARKAAAKKSNGAAAAAAKMPYVPTHEEIALLALQYWEQRGRAHGQHVQDWLRAEQDLLQIAS